MVLWAFNEDGVPITGKTAIELRKKGEEHTYYSPEYRDVEVIIRSGTSTPLAQRRDHFFLKEPLEKEAERRDEAEIGRIGIEAVLRDSGDIYEVGRGRLFTEFDGYVSHHQEGRVHKDTGFDVVYARQSRDGKAPIDYVIFVFDSVPNSDDYWRTVVSCSKSGPKNGVEKYVVKENEERTTSLGTRRNAKNGNGKVYVATVLTGDADDWSKGENSFVRDILMKTGLPVNYYDLKDGVMTSVGPKLEKYAGFRPLPVDFAKGKITIGTANPKTNDIPLGLAELVEQTDTQTSLFSSVQGSLF